MPNEPTNPTLQIVAMRVKDEMFGIDISHINTVITPQPITPVPQTESHVRGVMNLRGKIVPVLDLRKRFGLDPLSDEEQNRNRIVIVEVDGFLAGLTVDEVSEVLTIPLHEVAEPSNLLHGADRDMITGICRTRLTGADETQDSFVLLLDVRKILLNELPDSSQESLAA